MKLKQEKMLPESPKTIDITGFFKKFCIATRTILSTHKGLSLGWVLSFLLAEECHGLLRFFFWGG